MSGAACVDENQSLLSDYLKSSEPLQNLNASTLKYSYTTSHLVNTCGDNYDNIPAATHKVLSCPNLVHTSCGLKWSSNGFRETACVENELLKESAHAENSSLSHETIVWHPNYLIPPKVDHPLEESLLRSLPINCLRHICGFIVGMTFLSATMLMLLIVKPLKILYYLLTKCTFRGLERIVFAKTHCDPMWPWGQDHRRGLSDCQSRDNFILVATLQSGVDTEPLMQIIWRRIIRHLKQSNDILPDDDMREHVKLIWAKDEAYHVNTLDDLEAFLGDVYTQKMSTSWCVYVLTDFGDSSATLVLLKQRAIMSDDILCPLKMLCVLNDSKLFFTSTPHFKSEIFAKQLCINFTICLWNWFTVLSVGSVEVLTKMFRAPSQLWNHAKKRLTSLKNQTSNSNGVKLTWARLTNVELLSHAERVLRVSTQELLTSFVAGAIRRHLKASGIKHPPAIWVNVPLALHEKPCSVGIDRPCSFTLIPVSLATDIDGGVPRAWETQRRFFDAVESSFWRTCRFMTSVFDHFLSRSLTRKLLSATNSHCDGFVCFWRTVNELSISQRKVYSLLTYPPMAKSCFRSDNSNCHSGKFGFSFVQTGREIMLSVLVDSNDFPDANLLLHYFQIDFRNLLRHLSMKMTTFTQISIFPQPTRVKDASDEDNDASNVVDAAAVIITQNNESIEELELLLVTVENELEEMKKAPTDKCQSDYLMKLAELETKMDAFHVEIIDKLKSVNPSKIPYEKQLGETRWYDMLRRYSLPTDVDEINGHERKRMSIPHISPKHRLRIVSEWP